MSFTSLFGCAAVVIAVALAKLAMGVGLERVAWVASALSMGIGFGLQAVVQNFVSGLILLAERPMKVGDWVSLGGVEGDIRRINVRATKIQMGNRSTVIVPNSEFITEVVRNVTLADPLGLVQLRLLVPLGADAQQVRELLRAAFAAEDEVLDAPPRLRCCWTASRAATCCSTRRVSCRRRGWRPRCAVRCCLTCWRASQAAEA